MSSNDQVEVYADEVGEWRWRRWRSSDIVSMSSEGYVNRADCIEMAKTLNPGIPVTFEEAL